MELRTRLRILTNHRRRSKGITISSFKVSLETFKEMINLYTFAHDIEEVDKPMGRTKFRQKSFPHIKVVVIFPAVKQAGSRNRKCFMLATPGFCETSSGGEKGQRRGGALRAHRTNYQKQKRGVAHTADIGCKNQSGHRNRKKKHSTYKKKGKPHPSADPSSDLRPELGH